MAENRVRMLGLALFGVAFGYCEAATVAYIRLIGKMPPGLDYRESWALRGLQLNGETIVSEMRRMGLLPVEYGREIATLVMLVAIAMLAGRSRREKMAAFVLCFTVWDLTYYGWMSLFSGFPHNLVQTDIYFLLPFPTYGPIWFPLVLMTVGLVWSVKKLRGTAESADSQRPEVE